MLEPTPTRPNLDFGELFLWNGENKDQLWLPIVSTTYFE